VSSFGKVPDFFCRCAQIFQVAEILLSVFSFTRKLLKMTLSTNELVISLVIAFGLAGILAYIFWIQRKQAKQGLPTSKPETAVTSAPLKLQAYERLILLADRIALPNLISRTNQPGLNVREMQNLLVQTVRQEFDYNITQQIYVSPEAWDAIRNLKEQNLLIINQVASYLPETATGQDLNKSLLEMVMQNPKASLHHLVSDALSFEAKKVLD
jgi:hypothetical protein